MSKRIDVKCIAKRVSTPDGLPYGKLGWKKIYICITKLINRLRKISNSIMISSGTPDQSSQSPKGQ